MRPRRAHLLIALASLLGVLSVAAVDLSRPSPGPLAAAHAREAGLSGRFGCSECHGGWFEEMGAACLDCHRTVAGHVERGAGLHGKLATDVLPRCASCHADHHGEGFALVSALSFARAGIPDRDAFDHARLSFELDGRHAELACAECHEHADAAVIPAGASRYVGLDPDCAGCHEDPHAGRMEPACADCHAQASFEALHARGHEAHLPLAGGHAELSCRECHEQDGPRALEISGRGALEPRDCLACHESPHAAEFARRAAEIADVEVGASCGACHAAEHRSFREPGLAVDPKVHAGAGFSLDAPHAEVACALCHAPEQGEFAARYPGRSADECGQCHDDPHRGQFDGGSGAGARCLDCHARERFEPHEFGLDDHGRTDFALEASHASADCNACHAEPADGDPRAFRGVPARCELCHADAHGGSFDAALAGSRDSPAGTCARCHRSTEFADMAPADFDHGFWTGFPVRGAHAEDGCESCHVPRAEPDALGRRFGRVEERFGAVHGCASCHGDPHEGGFDRGECPAEVGGRAGCARCHGETSFRDFPHGFAHAAFTGFELEGAHAAADCAACHAPLRAPDESGRTWGRAHGAECAACHTDAHAGQFTAAHAGQFTAAHAGQFTAAHAGQFTGLRSPTASCERCHAGASGWDALVFDHGLDSRFRLDEAHARLECARCHVPRPVPGGRAVVLYKPLATDCAECHAVQGGPRLSRKEGKP